MQWCSGFTLSSGITTVGLGDYMWVLGIEHRLECTRYAPYPLHSLAQIIALNVTKLETYVCCHTFSFSELEH